MSLLPKIDTHQTKENVDRLLEDYHRLKRLAGRPAETNITATISSEPKGDSTDNTSKHERAVMRKLMANKYVEDIHVALTKVSASAKHWLFLKYIHNHNRYDYEIYTDYKISETTYYRYLGQAQLEFAEVYRDGVLLVEVE